MRLARLHVAGALTGLLGLAACQGDRAPTDPSSTSAPSFAVTAASPKRYIITTNGDKLPPNIERGLADAGGTVEATLPQIGVAIVRAKDASFATKAKAIAGVSDALADQRVKWVDPAAKFQEATNLSGPPTIGASGLGDGETFFAFQWAPRSISAPAAWDVANQRGAGVRVAIIDGGIYDKHIDIEPNLDKAHSKSFALDDDGNLTAYNEDVGTFWHGTHVAGIVAAPANGLGTIGIAPEATIIGVKALHNGSGDFGAVIQAIVYAATPIAEGGAGADVINMSLGAVFPRQGRELAQLAVVLSKATAYANKRGVTVLAATGNDAIDFDHSANLVSVPAMSSQVLAIAATGPVDFANGGTNFTRPASYSNYGQSLVSFAAPGGDDTLFPVGNWAFDMVLGPCRGSGASVGSYCFADGTSMATPAATGVVALIIGKYGRIGPTAIEARLRKTSDDLGKPGNDDFYGKGFVNAFRAVQ
ncbi:MAG TPA: S8 family serine peptidase [Gemmatimonadales bacterium]|nr:S8 family serine peptidase [Gemmatimonadales bacterium]